MIGLIVSSLPAVQYGPLFYRNIEIDKNEALHKNKGNFEALMQLSPESREDLSWWVRTLPQAYKQIDLSNPDIEVTTDASKIGWGQSALGTQLKVCGQNLNAMGGTKSPTCNKRVQDIWTWCMQNKVWLSASHLPVALNVEADQQSRQFNERTEWHLRKDVFHQISKIWGTPDIDVFSSRINSQLPKYASWKPDPGATHVDTFSFAWTRMFAYLFPPFCLIARCRKKLEIDGVLGLIVVHLWPTQAWWPQLLNLLIATPVILPQHKDLLTLPHNGMEHPPKDQAKDGGMSVIREFYQTQGISRSATKLLLASWRGGTKKQYDVYIKKWTKFCAERQANQIHAIVVDVLDFFTELYEKGFTYSAINTARSALSSFVLLDDGSSVGKNPLFSRLLKGVFQSRAPKPKYTEVWDVQIVLSYLRTLHPVDSLSLKDLSFKFMLLLLVSGQRGQTIHMLALNDMIGARCECERRVAAFLLDPLKNTFLPFL